MFSWEHCKIVKNTYLAKHLRTAASDNSYILLKKLNEIVQEPDCLSVSFWNMKLLYFTYSHSYSIVLHSLSFSATEYHFLFLVAIRCQSLYDSLSIVLPLVVTRCHSLSLFVTCCTTRCHSLSLIAPFVVCLFINDPFQV